MSDHRYDARIPKAPPPSKEWVKNHTLAIETEGIDEIINTLAGCYKKAIENKNYELSFFVDDIIRKTIEYKKDKING